MTACRGRCMGTENASLFSAIAPVYGLFYRYQLNRFRKLLAPDAMPLALDGFTSVIDIGCGTGALCAALKERGLTVSCVDRAPGMLAVARKRPGNAGIRFSLGNALTGLDFPEKAFDIAIASHVAHGLEAPDRQALYREMARLARHYVLLYDYFDNNAPLTALIERMEGGDYFRFIKDAPQELSALFPEVQMAQAGKRSGWYICRL